MMPKGSISKVKCVCANCGKTILKHKCELSRRYNSFCNKKCEGEFKKGKPVSKETGMKISIALKGRVFTPEWRANISKAMKGKPNWRKGKSVSEEQKKKQSLAMVGRRHTEEHNTSIRQHTPKGKDSPHWRGGLTSLTWQIRYCWEMYDWREKVFKRDDFRDWFSGIKGNGNLHAHHIISFSSIIKKYNIQSLDDAIACKELWDLNNGVTMIDTSHLAHHSMWGDYSKEEV